MHIGLRDPGIFRFSEIAVPQIEWILSEAHGLAFQFDEALLELGVSVARCDDSAGSLEAIRKRHNAEPLAISYVSNSLAYEQFVYHSANRILFSRKIVMLVSR